MAAGLKLNAGHEAGADLGPMISQKALHRAEALIQKGVEQVGHARTHAGLHACLLCILV